MRSNAYCHETWGWYHRRLATKRSTTTEPSVACAQIQASSDSLRAPVAASRMALNGSGAPTSRASAAVADSWCRSQCDSAHEQSSISGSAPKASAGMRYAVTRSARTRSADISMNASRPDSRLKDLVATATMSFSSAKSWMARTESAEMSLTISATVTPLTATTRKTRSDGASVDGWSIVSSAMQPSASATPVADTARLPRTTQTMPTGSSAAAIRAGPEPRPWLTAATAKVHRASSTTTRVGLATIWPPLSVMLRTSPKLNATLRAPSTPPATSHTGSAVIGRTTRARTSISASPSNASTMRAAVLIARSGSSSDANWKSGCRSRRGPALTTPNRRVGGWP